MLNVKSQIKSVAMMPFFMAMVMLEGTPRLPIIMSPAACTNVPLSIRLRLPTRSIRKSDRMTPRTPTAPVAAVAENGLIVPRDLTKVVP